MRHVWRREWLVFPLFAAGSLGLSLLGQRIPLPYIILAFMNHGLLAGLVMALSSAPWEEKLLASSVLIAVFTIFGDFCCSFLSVAFLAFLHLTVGIPEPFLVDWMNSLIVFLSILAVAVAVCLLAGRAGAVLCGKERKWYLTAAVPLFLLTAVTDVADWCASHGILLKIEGNLYYAQLLSHGEICVLAALCLSAAACHLFGMNRVYEERQKSSRYQCQVTAYRMLTEQHRQAERLRHDLKNHVIALQGLVEERDWEAMEDYLEAMEESGGLGDGRELAGSPALGALLGRKRREAENQKIRWECSVDPPDGFGFWEFDLCVLFGNLLDNAIAACGRIPEGEDRFLRIRARTVKRCFLLEVKNSAGRKEGTSGTGAGGRSGERKGLGLQNVRDVVERYHGTMETEEKDGVFTSLTLLPAKGIREGDPKGEDSRT